jgi:hypothetical protein
VRYDKTKSSRVVSQNNHYPPNPNHHKSTKYQNNNKKLSIKKTAYWNSMSEQQRSELKKKFSDGHKLRYSHQTQEQKEKRSATTTKMNRKYWDNLTEEQYADRCAKLKRSSLIALEKKKQNAH